MAKVVAQNNYLEWILELINRNPSTNIIIIFKMYIKNELKCYPEIILIMYKIMLGNQKFGYLTKLYTSIHKLYV